MHISGLTDLARSLNNLSFWSSDLGQREEALAATQEAVKLCRQLTTRNPDAFQLDLSNILTNLGHWLNELGLHEEALAATREAEQLLSRIGATDDSP
jgi:tetratricopeptide (TPR) repeat protein